MFVHSKQIIGREYRQQLSYPKAALLATRSIEELLLSLLLFNDLFDAGLYVRDSVA
jgi:hypothetical protein